MSVYVNQMIQGKGLNKFLRLDEKTMLMQKQGNIVNTILGDKKSAATTWLSQNVLSPMKKASSSEKLSHSKEHEPLDVWSSILNQKTSDESSKLSVPYIVKSSKSCMSEKSLEICTECLGSETGSNGFSSEEVNVEACHNEKEVVQVSKYKSLKRCFPPPLPSLSSPSLQMRPHRDNRRLLLQAVSVTSQNNFLAKRQNGRLVLTFASEENEEEKDCVEKEDEDVKLIEQTPMLVPRLALTLVVFNAYEHYWRTKPLGNAALLLPSHEQNNCLSLKKNNISSKVVEQSSNEPKQLVVLRGKNGDYLVQNFKNCKDFRRSFLFWDPNCIAA